MRRHYRKYLGNFGLKRKALVIFLLFVILPTFGVGVVVQYKFNQILRDQFVNSTKRNLDNVTNQLEEQTRRVEDIANYLILSPDMRSFLRSSPPLGSEQREKLKRNIEEFLTFQLMSRSYIRSIEIAGYNGSLIQMGEPFRGDESRWELQAEARKGGMVWTEGYSLNSDWNGDVRILSMFRILNSYSEITKPTGRLTIRMDEASIVDLLEKGIFEDGAGTVFIIGPEGQVILRSKDDLGDRFVPDEAMLGKLDLGQEGFFSYPIDGKAYMTLFSSMDNTGWNVVAMIPETTVSEGFRGVKLLMLFILAAILLLGLTALIGFHYTIIMPILRLKKETYRVMHGDFTARVPIESRDEIAELNHKFNEMVATIQQLIDHKYKLELRERESELKLLQNQMDPHFLYNTLDMIRWTARLEKAEKSSQLIEMLSKFFRSSVNNGSYKTTLRREMEFVQSYLYLQQRRLGEKLKYTLHTEAGLEDTLMLKATVQPLVENFLKHGFDRTKAVNEISVNCYAAHGEIWIDVIDNGKGMNRGTWVKGDGKPGAMSNIHERLSIFFGPEYGLKVIGTSAQGTWVRLRVPKGESQEDHGGERHEQ
ncbi:sensor histidine kinase [Paenibacillus sp. alder61]|uniref:Sensor histidine kinase n=1 Tax=Paenibacillus faecis TaxID=862114 RepID=A0A5D0CVB8_9BACL|nr:MULTISPECIES: sensor histidine kinase [Paenibacillus]MCA1292870.1 sensor histidine kinase [Paenibacillus sp. alder61]TYA12835.1 sensor histidine kinase [Paenibacillus faecis]